MNIMELRKQRAALKKAEGVIEIHEPKEEKATDGRLNILDAFKHLVSQQAYNAAKFEAAQWRDPEVVSERIADYTQKVYGSKAENGGYSNEDVKTTLRNACTGFAEIFGKTFSQLPSYQQRGLVAFLANHFNHLPNGPLALGMNLKKGLGLCGSPQCGKTSVFIYLKSLPQVSVRIISAIELQRMVSQYGEIVIEQYGKKGKHLVIDELGWDKPIKNYGTDIDCVPEIIHARYDRGLTTHFTSNMKVEELRYDDYIKARLIQSCNIIDCGSENFFEV